MKNQLSGVRIESFVGPYSNILRMDSPDRPEFWIEVDMAYFAEMPEDKSNSDDKIMKGGPSL